MPDAGYFGLTYELLFEGDVAWTDITALVDSRTTKVDIAGCSEGLKSVISKCSFEMRYNSSPSMSTHSTIVSKILTAKQAGENVLFRMGGIATFVGKVDLGSFSQKNGRIPGFLTVTCEDNSYLLDEVMATSFEYPDNGDLDDEGYAVFDKANLAESIVMLRLLDAGYTIDQIDLTSSDSITEKVRRVVYDADDERTYREMLDTLLFEHCAVIYTTPEGKLSVRRLYRESPVSERSVEEFLVGDGIETGGGDYSYDGVKVVWSNLSKLDGAVVYNANITMKLDDKGNREGEEIQPQHYWPENGDIEETWQEFNATFLDRPYQTKVSRLKNKDLSLISVKNAYYEVDKDAEILLANNPPEIEPTKARVLWWNSHSTDVKKLYGFTIVGDALFRSKLNESTYPTDARKLDEPYETEFVYTSEAAQKLANHLHRFRKYGDLHHKWSEIGVATPLFQVVTVSAPDTLISSLGMVISQSISFPAPNKIKRSNSAIGITAFNSEPVKTRSIQLGGAPVNTGPAGENGMRSVVQYALGTIDAPYTDGTTKVGTDLALVGTSIACLGTDNSGVWTTNIPSPTLSEYVWRREGYYISPATFPTTWEVTRLTGNKGDSAVHGELSNDSHTIPTDVNGDNGNFTGCETTLHMYVGGTDDSDNWTYSAGISAGVTASLAGNTLTVTAMTTDTGYVDITASKSGYDDVVRRFSLSKSKQGAVGADATAYWLVSSVAAVKKTQASAYVPATVTFSSKSQTGSGSPAYYDGRFVISESTDGLAWTAKYTSASDEHAKEYTPSASIVAIKCELYQAGGTVLLLDEETVPFVLDGTDGAVAQGVYLTASRGAISVTSRGTVYGTDILISAVLQNLTGTVTWSVDIGTGTLTGSDNLFRTLDISTVTTDEIVIKATVGGFSATYGFAKVYDGMPAPVYAGVKESAPDDIGGEPLVTGDCFLYMPKVGEAYDDSDPLFGHVLKWDGDSWESTTDSQSIGFAAKDAFAIARESGKVIFAAVIYTEAMVAANIQAGSGTGAAGSGFRFRAMDDDYSQEGNPKVPVFDVMYDNKKLFEVVATGTDAGDVVIGDYANGNGIKYDKSAGKFSVKGTIEAGSLIPFSNIRNGLGQDGNNNNFSTFGYTTTPGYFPEGTSGSFGVSGSTYIECRNDDFIQVDTTKSYTLDMWVYGTNGTESTSHYLMFVCFDENKQLIESVPSGRRNYIASGIIGAGVWEKYSITILGNDLTSDNKFRTGTRFIKVGCLFNYSQDAYHELYIAGITLREATPFSVDGTAFQTANGKVKIYNDGTIEAVDGTFSGHVEANSGSFTGNIIANSGYFKGIFDTTALRLEPSDASTISKVSSPSMYQADDIISNALSNGLSLNVFYTVSLGLTSIQIVTYYYPNTSYSTKNLTNVKYIQMKANSAFNGNTILFYDSSYNEITRIFSPESGRTSHYMYINTTFTIIIGYGGDKLIISSDTPTLATGLTDYQLYLDPSTGNVKYKLP